MNRPLVSVHCVTYNQAKYVEKAIESAASQDYQELQIVVSDDGSTDGTDVILERLAERYPSRLHVITNRSNLGITRNCNRALKACRGEYIAFLAGDDYYLPGKISAQMEWFEKNPDAVLCGHQLLVHDQKTGSSRQWAKTLTAGRGPARWIEYGPQYGSLSIMIRSWVVPERGFDERISMVSDNKMWVDCLSSGGLYGYLPESYAVYVKHSSNYTNNKVAGIKELDIAFSTIEADYPMFAAECRRGRVNLIDYGLALYEFERDCYSNALRKFFMAWIRNPRNPKSLLRVAQALYRIVG